MVGKSVSVVAVICPLSRKLSISSDLRSEYKWVLAEIGIGDEMGKEMKGGWVLEVGAWKRQGIVGFLMARVNSIAEERPEKKIGRSIKDVWTADWFNVV